MKVSILKYPTDAEGGDRMEKQVTIWNKVEDLLPEDGERVLGCIGNSVYEVCHANGYWQRFGANAEVIFGQKVTAWTPLPGEGKTEQKPLYWLEEANPWNGLVKLADKRYVCPVCGDWNYIPSKYCRNCGARVHVAEEDDRW